MSKENWGVLALADMVGINYMPDKKAYEGWGSTWSSKGKGVAGLSTYPFSAMRALQTFQSTYNGYQQQGWYGAAKGLGIEFLTSGIMANSLARGAYGAGASALARSAGVEIIGGQLGMMATGGPWGYLGGVAVADSLVTGGIAASGVAVGLPLLAAAGTAYFAGKGSYALMKNGYNYRQRMQTKIDTAGSTAAFMNKNAFSMRSRAVEIIRNNHLNARSALGQEASMIHFNSYRKVMNNRLF